MKLLHERLSEFVNDSDEEAEGIMVDNFEIWLWKSEAEALAENIERNYIPREQHEKEIKNTKATSAGDFLRLWAFERDIPFGKDDNISDWIERWFIQRPRYESKEPIDFGCGDIEWNDGRTGWMFNAVDNDGIPIAIDDSKICAKAKMTIDGFVVRKKPNVYDADGVEIKVGDTVWDSKGYKGVVKSVTPVQIVIENGFNNHSYLSPDILTHKEPDSLEKLRDDIIERSEHSFTGRSEIYNWADRLSALIEKGA